MLLIKKVYNLQWLTTKFSEYGELQAIYRKLERERRKGIKWKDKERELLIALYDCGM